VDTQELYADDQLWESVFNFRENLDVEVGTADLPSVTVRAKLLGE